MEWLWRERLRGEEEGVETVQGINRLRWDQMGLEMGLEMRSDLIRLVEMGLEMKSDEFRLVGMGLEMG